MTDWNHIRAIKFSRESPSDWPPHVRAISQEGLALLGINTKTGKLYWDGTEIVLKRTLALTAIQQTFAILAAVGTFGSFVLLLGKAIKLWP